MFKKILLLFLFISATSFAQHTIKGTMKPAEKYPWMMAYKLNGAKQDFITYDSIQQGEFTLNITKNRKKGIYRLIYDVQNRLFLDVFYDNEDIEFSFNPRNPQETVKFLKSKNNILYQNYSQTISSIERTLDSLQIAYFKSPNKNLETVYSKTKELLTKTQQRFEKEAQGLLVYDFIKSNKKYYSNALIKSPENYLKTVNQHYYDYVDFTSPTLSNSTFYHNKINEYIFRLNSSDDAETLKQLRKKAIDFTLEKIKNNVSLSQDIQEGLLYNFAQAEKVDMTNHVLNHYLKLPKQHQDTDFIDDVKGRLKTAIGNIAPNIFWGKDKETLHMLNDSPNYLVFFWSSGCGHCIKELPKLAEYIKTKPNVKVIAVGLETELSKPVWEQIITGHPNWIHVYGKDKWKNRYVKEYGVSSTPSFYLLDSKKKIIAKPDDTVELKKYFNQN